MSTTTPSFVDVKIILEIDGTGQYDEVYSWRVIARSGIMNPVPRFKSGLDNHFQKLFTKQDRPTCEIYLRHTDQRRAFFPIQW